MNDKFCINCRHCREGFVQLFCTKHPHEDHTTGVEKPKQCKLVRLPVGECGPEGKGYEPK